MIIEKLHWKSDIENIDFNALSHLYKVAPLGDKSA